MKQFAQAPWEVKAGSRRELRVAWLQSKQFLQLFVFVFLNAYVFICVGSWLWHTGPSIFFAACRIFFFFSSSSSVATHDL